MTSPTSSPLPSDSSDAKTSAPPASTAPAAPVTDWNTFPAVLYIWLPACALAFLLAVVPYGSGYGFDRVPLAFLMRELWKMPDWEHCFLVPMAIAFIIYEMRDRLVVLRPEPSWLGWPVLVGGLFLYWAGQRVDNQYVGYASMQILVAAYILCLLGWRFGLTLFFPWAFLVFLWPLLFLETYLAFPLRLVMSEASVQTLNFLGIESVKMGTAILSAADPLANLPVGARFMVDVADPCSGIRSLFALMMVSALYGFFIFRSPWKHAVIFMASIPLAILGNLFRILLLTVGTLLFGAEFAIGEGIEDPSTFHMVAGFFVFAVALGGMLLIGWLLNFDFFAWGRKLFVSYEQALASREKALTSPAQPLTDSPSPHPSKKNHGQKSRDDLY